MQPAAWYPDPSGHAEFRYWDGSTWTEHVATNGVAFTAPLTPARPATQEAEQPAPASVVEEPAPSVVDEPAPASVVEEPEGRLKTTTTPPPEAEQPAPASVVDKPEPSEAEAPAPASVVEEPEGHLETTTPPAVDEAPAPAAPATPGTATPRPPGITGDLVDGRFAEIEGVGPANQNIRMLRVRLGEPFLARQGAMVAYQGQVQFAYKGGGMGRFMKKAFTGEGLSLMEVSGSGDVFLANSGHQVHLLQLTDAGVSINGANVLAFGGGLDWNVERVKGGSMMTGGLFNTTLRGTGWVAITTDGEPVVLDAGMAPTYADSNAVVAWSADLTTSLHSSMTAGAMIGRGSGEAIQVTFSGAGFVIVQPSEGVAVPGQTL